MKKQYFTKVAAIAAATVLAGAFLAGCGSVTEEARSIEEATTIVDEAVQKVALSDAPKMQEEAEVPGAPYFEAGVYAIYTEDTASPKKTNFYVFNTDTYGYTADGTNHGIGLPFDYKQNDGSVRFQFGGAGEYEDVFTVKAVENGKIIGAFDDGLMIVFEKIDGVDPDTFDAENYVADPHDFVYHDANGWSVHYDSTLIDITRQDGTVFMVYTGDCPGTNMVIVDYKVENNAENAIKELGKSWGEKTQFSQGIFPGTEDITGYWAMLPPSDEGSGMHMTAVARDYMQGALIFEYDGHNGNDEAMNMTISDTMANIIDSLTFDSYGEDDGASMIEAGYESFNKIISTLPAGSYYAFADMDKDHDVLLVTDYVFDNLDGNMATTEADVYGFDKNGDIVKYGHIAAGGTATPLAAKDSEVFVGGHSYMNKLHLDEKAGEIVTVEGEFFDEYENAIVINFSSAY